MAHQHCSFTVIGGGSWGTALANLLAKKGNAVRLWVYEKELVDAINIRHENHLFLPGVPLDHRLQATGDLSGSVRGSSMVLLVPPSQILGRLVGQIEDALDPDALVVCASKGIENESLALMSEVLTTQLPSVTSDRVVFLSGPSFAKEVATEHPTAVTAASTNLRAAERTQEIFSTDYFRVYSSSDVIGAEIGGSIKNVIALAAGVSDGLGFGYNTRAALITRGLAEMARLGVAKGADEKSFLGLAGIGDLVLTCTGELSRNRTVGLELGRGKKLEEILGGMTMVAEGVKTTLSAYQLAARLGIEMPIVNEMYRILYENKNPREAVSDLMGRRLKREHEEV